MSAIRTNAAAAMLGVSPNTLRSWESRYGYPSPRRSEGGHRQFDLTEIDALKQGLAQTGEISSAIALATARGEGPSTPARLSAAFTEFDEDKADRLLDESLAVRSVERTVESVLLPAVQSLAQAHAEHVERDIERAANIAETPEYCFAWRYATGWLSAAQRVAPPSSREEGVLIFDASAALDMDGLRVQALELFARRAGLRVLTLSMELDSARVGNALRVLCPQAVVLAGGGASLDAIGRLVYATRQSAVGELEILDYCGALPETGASTVTRIGPGPAEALDTLRERLARPDPARRDDAQAAQVTLAPFAS
jgi:MerR family transcriptional regulator, light-induced transcriptional regulator